MAFCTTFHVRTDLRNDKEEEDEEEGVGGGGPMGGMGILPGDGGSVVDASKIREGSASGSARLERRG